MARPLAPRVIAAALCAVGVLAQPYWWKFSGSDIIGDHVDIENDKGATIPQLEARCAAMPSCVAFNTNGEWTS
jgi:hypothetical protein